MKRFLELQRKRQEVLILSDADHAIAIRRINKLMKADPQKDSKDGKALLRLAESVERYEKKRWPL